MSDTLLPSVRNLERVDSWGLAIRNYSHVYRPTTIEEIKAVFKLARENQLTIGMRGTGCSYGDASLNESQITLDLTRFNRILSWDKSAGIIEVEAGVTVQQLWQATLEDGYWPPVVSGTMFPTMGGICAMNIHGKNNFKVGPIGAHVRSFELLLADGGVKKCSRDENPELFHAAIGGFGMLGVFTKIILQMKKIYSGYISVEPIVGRDLNELFDLFEERLPHSDYLVGWVDCLARGSDLGRGVLHQANYLEPGQDPHPETSLRVANQGLPDKILGVFPKALMWVFMQPFVNTIGMSLINAAKYWSARLSLRGHRYLQSHAGFNFLLDYVPNWKWAYRQRNGEGGLIQYQPFVPKEQARALFEKIIRLAQEEGLPPFLGVLKRHQSDPFLLTHALDGYSFALDFKVTEQNRERLWEFLHRLDALVVEAGGKFYFAKDSTLEPQTVEKFFGEKRLAAFAALKSQCDPQNLFCTDLSQRLFHFGGARAARQETLSPKRLRLQSGN